IPTVKFKEFGLDRRIARHIHPITLAIYIRFLEGFQADNISKIPTISTDQPFSYGASISVPHRLNFSTFLAKLASTRIVKIKMCLVVHLVLPRLFNGPRELHTREQSDEDLLNRAIRQLEVVQPVTSCCCLAKSK
ncbi:hypothetical protein F1880_007838, partial [Penicillium rolfsii]